MMHDIEALGFLVFVTQAAVLAAIVYGVRRYMKSRNASKQQPPQP